jgi:hypothetical protein
MGGGDGNRTRVQGFAGPCLSHSATPPQELLRRRPTCRIAAPPSGRRDSNPRPSPWQGDALPTEPRPHSGPWGRSAGSLRRAYGTVADPGAHANSGSGVSVKALFRTDGSDSCHISVSRTVGSPRAAPGHGEVPARGGTGRGALHRRCRECGAGALARDRERCSRPARGIRAGKLAVCCLLGGLTEQVGQFGLDVDMVTLIARRHNLIRAAKEVRDLLDGSLEVRLAER